MTSVHAIPPLDPHYLPGGTGEDIEAQRVWLPSLVVQTRRVTAGGGLCQGQAGQAGAARVGQAGRARLHLHPSEPRLWGGDV